MFYPTAVWVVVVQSPTRLQRNGYELHLILFSSRQAREFLIPLPPYLASSGLTCANGIGRVPRPLLPR